MESANSELLLSPGEKSLDIPTNSSASPVTPSHLPSAGEQKGPKYDQDLFNLLTSEVPPGEVKHEVIGKDELQRIELSKFIEEYKGDKKWLPYEVLFRLMGIKKEEANMGIPFLREDPVFSIPGVKNLFRMNICNEIPMKDRSMEEQLEDMRGYAKHYMQKLPEIPIIIADITSGFPLKSDSLDVLVFNYGVMVEEIPIQHIFSNKPRIGKDGLPERNKYIKDARRVVKPGGLVIVLEYDFFGPQLKAENVSALIGANTVEFDLPSSILDLLREKTGIEGKKFEDFFKVPDFEEISFHFLKMPENKQEPTIQRPGDDGDLIKP